jgi:hypothetical protein
VSDLHDALQDRIVAHTPDTVPPFDALKDRKRARDRRRYAVAAAALSAVAVAGIAAATTWRSGPPDRLPTLAGPASPAANGPSPSPVERAAIRPPSESRMEAELTGTLNADPTTGCLWIDPGRGLMPIELLLQGGDGYRIDFSATPATIRDGETVLATVGEKVELGGGSTGREGDGVPGCPVSGPTFLGYFAGRPWSTD